jgi:hypothetical protein
MEKEKEETLSKVSEESAFEEDEEDCFGEAMKFRVLESL